MQTRNIGMSIAVAAAVVAGAPTLGAHHGTNINYDRSKVFTAKAVVTEFKYVNPHAQLFFDVTDSQGNITHWTGELLPNPSQLLRSGWTRKRSVEALQFGTRIVVTVAPSRAGGQAGLVLKIEDDKGEELRSGGANAGGPDVGPQRGSTP
jgi:hypothetical protein